MTIPFKRGIDNPVFIQALNALYEDKNSFWRKMLDDSELFIAIRDNYINVYYYGQSLCKLTYSSKAAVVRGETHKKYLGIDKSGYLTSIDGVFTVQSGVKLSLGDLDELKKNIEDYIGDEKRCSYQEILKPENHVIDVEITFVKESKKEDVKYENSSVDYLALEDNRLVFYEAKHIKNPELRSTTEAKVLGQIRRYTTALGDHKDEILKSYDKVLENLVELHINPKVFPKETIEIDSSPRLIIFEVEDEKNEHIEKLRRKLKNNLILNMK